MITIERTRDYSLIRSIITHPRIYPWIASDFHPPAETFWPSESDVIHYMLIRHDHIPVGVMMAHPIHTPSTWEIHTCILPIGWRYTSEIARVFFRWLFSETPCQTAVGFTPVCNRLACRYSLREGMRRIGVISKGYPKDGKLYDIMVTERTRE